MILVCFNLSLLTIFNFDTSLNRNCVYQTCPANRYSYFLYNHKFVEIFTNSDFGQQYLYVVAVIRYQPYLHLVYFQSVVSRHFVHRIFKIAYYYVTYYFGYDIHLLKTICTRRGNLISQYQFPCLTRVIITNYKQSKLIILFIFIYIFSHSPIRNHRILST